MGFGTLFFGYFLLLDLPYQTLTNVAAAALIMYALFKLAYLNRPFRYALIFSYAFGVFAFGEAVLEVLSMLYIIKLESIPLAIALHSVRNILIGGVTFLMLLGMKEIASEVMLKRLSKKCDIWAKISFVIYCVNLALIPNLERLADERILYALYATKVVVSILTLFVICMNLTCIYGCYSSICMPSENTKTKEVKEKSRFAFVNKFREHEDEKRREYAEYKIQKRQKKGKK